MNDMAPRRTGWVTVAEDQRHPRLHRHGDVVYHVERDAYSFLTFNTERDAYDSDEFTKDDAASLGLPQRRHDATDRERHHP